jgi:hypothetical protein
MLRHKCEAAGGVTEWCRQNGISNPYVSMVLSGKQGVGEKIYTALGYRKEIVFIACKSKSKGI